MFNALLRLNATRVEIIDPRKQHVEPQSPPRHVKNGDLHDERRSALLREVSHDSDRRSSGMRLKASRGRQWDQSFVANVA
jgi:hypothetical protein